MGKPQLLVDEFDHIEEYGWVEVTADTDTPAAAVKHFISDSWAWDESAFGEDEPLFPIAAGREWLQPMLPIDWGAEREEDRFIVAPADRPYEGGDDEVVWFPVDSSELPRATEFWRIEIVYADDLRRQYDAAADKTAFLTNAGISAESVEHLLKATK